MTTAFVLSVGGSLGAVQVGMLQALAERDVHPDLLIGTSAGALNAAYVASHGTSPQALDDLASVWRRLRRHDLFPFDPVRHTLAVTGLRPSLCSNHNLHHLIDAHVPYHRLQDAAIAVHVVTTNLLSGEEVLLSDGDATSAVLASATIPGVFPAVQRDGLTLVDGGVANNAAVSQAVALGADEIYILPAGFACALPRPPGTAIGAAVQALTLLIEQRLITDVTHFAGHAPAKGGDTAKVATAKDTWYANADSIADFLAAANPVNWPATEMRHMMHDHLDNTLAEAVDHLNGDYTADIADYDKVHTQILTMADMLTNGIIAQFPDKFA